jgi:hypothetical protein
VIQQARYRTEFLLSSLAGTNAVKPVIDLQLECIFTKQLLPGFKRSKQPEFEEATELTAMCSELGRDGRKSDNAATPFKRAGCDSCKKFVEGP